MRKDLERLRHDWQLMTLYERFEQLVAFILTLAIAAIVGVALLNLAGHILELVASARISPQNHQVFRNVFSGIMTLLIALEFKHSILHWAFRDENIIQVKTVLAVSLLALARKFIILDMEATSALEVFALSAAVVALGGVYWLMPSRPSSPERADKRARRQVGQT